MNRSTKTRLLLRDKYKVVHSDRLYRRQINPSMFDLSQYNSDNEYRIHRFNNLFYKKSGRKVLRVFALIKFTN